MLWLNWRSQLNMHNGLMYPSCDLSLINAQQAPSRRSHPRPLDTFVVSSIMAAASPKAESPAAPPLADADSEPVCPVCLQPASDDDGPLVRCGCACRGKRRRGE